MAYERWRAGRSPHGTVLIFIAASMLSLTCSRRWPVSPRRHSPLCIACQSRMAAMKKSDSQISEAGIHGYRMDRYELQTTIKRQPRLVKGRGESVSGMAARPIGSLQESGAKTDVVHGACDGVASQQHASQQASRIANTMAAAETALKRLFARDATAVHQPSLTLLCCHCCCIVRS